jgi:flagellar hook-associated protein 3 FlgL
MRVTQAETYRVFLSNLESLNAAYNASSRQVSSGKKITQLSDCPEGSAELLALTDLQSDIDQYRTTANTASYYLNAADSALNEVNNLVTSIYTKGSEATSEITSSDERAALANEIRSLRDQILSLANSQAKGRYLFAGSKIDTAPFVIENDSISFQGDVNVNTVSLDGGVGVETGVPGADAFNSVFAAIGSLLSAIDSNDVSSVGAALGQFSSAISDLGLARGAIGASLNMIENAQTRLDSQETSMKSRRSQIEDADMATTIVQLQQTQTALQTTLSAGGSLLTQRNLFDLLG